MRLRAPILSSIPGVVIVCVGCVLGCVVLWVNGRFSQFMLDPARVDRAHAFTPNPGKMLRHNCLSGYAIPAYLLGRGLDPYTEDGRHKGVIPKEALRGLDPDETAPHNPPAFLTLMRGVVHGVQPDQFVSLRVRWFLLQAVIVVGALAASCWWMRDAWPSLFVPLLAVALSRAWFHNLQFQQTQILMAALATGGICAVAVGADLIAGVLIGLGVITNLSPALLLIPIALWRRYKAVAAAVAVVAAASVLSIAIDGWEVTHHYFFHTLPEVGANGGFSYPPEDRLGPPALLATQSLWGLLMKFRLLGLPKLAALARPLTKVLGLAVLALAGWIGWRRPVAPRERALMLLGLMSLIVVQHMHFWDFALITPLLALACVIADRLAAPGRDPRSVLTMVLMLAAFAILAYGSPTIDPKAPPPTAKVLYAMLPTLSIFAVVGWTLKRRDPRQSPL